jgi:hypothetical protein
VTARSVLVVDGFAEEARPLRDHFDERFADPRQARGDRFVWDFWHVPGQYTALRTPAWQYFPPRIYKAFHRRLVDWGRRTLGCHDVSPPWMSCYVEGCRQELHGDLPHGPWAFVYSLTDWQRRVFRGGETLVVRDEILDYWSGFVSERSIEEPDVLRTIEPRFNRLTVFDPRLPHGVRRVEGTLDPRLGRLVIHGWFVQPRPFVEGPLPVKELASGIERIGEALAPHLEGGLPLTGLLSIGFGVEARGNVDKARVLSDTTRVPAAHEEARRALLRTVLKAARSLRFRPRASASRVTLPLVFSAA